MFEFSLISAGAGMATIIVFMVTMSETVLEQGWQPWMKLINIL